MMQTQVLGQETMREEALDCARHFNQKGRFIAVARKRALAARP